MKKITFLAALLFMSLMAFAQDEKTATFDFNTMDVAVSSNNSTDGDITEDLVLVEEGVTMTVSPSTGSTANRLWSTNNGPQLRVYGGTVTIEAEGTIKKIEFTAPTWGTISANVGNLGNKLWEGEAEQVVFSISKKSFINKITVTYESAEEPEPQTVTIAANDVDGEYWATYFDSKQAYQVGDNATAYYGTLTEDGAWLVLNELTGNVIPANTAAIVKATSEVVELAPVDDAAAGVIGNVLSGSDEEIDNEFSYVKYLTLGLNEEDELGFWAYKNETLLAHKAFIDTDNLPVNANIKGVKLFDGTATAISSVATARQNTGAIYNLAGQQVDAQYKGIVIENGKKLIRK